MANFKIYVNYVVAFNGINRRVPTREWGELKTLFNEHTAARGPSRYFFSAGIVIFPKRLWVVTTDSGIRENALVQKQYNIDATCYRFFTTKVSFQTTETCSFSTINTHAGRVVCIIRRQLLAYESAPNTYYSPFSFLKDRVRIDIDTSRNPIGKKAEGGREGEN